MNNQKPHLPNFADIVLPAWWKFWETIPLAWQYVRAPQVPLNGRRGYIITSVIMLAYFIVPIDFIPEIFLPLIGYVDDVGLIPAWFAVTNMFVHWANQQLANKE